MWIVFSSKKLLPLMSEVEFTFSMFVCIVSLENRVIFIEKHYHLLHVTHHRRCKKSLWIISNTVGEFSCNYNQFNCHVLLVRLLWFTTYELAFPKPHLVHARYSLCLTSVGSAMHGCFCMLHVIHYYVHLDKINVIIFYQSAKAISKLAEESGESLTVFVQPLLKALLDELQNRFWEVRSFTSQKSLSIIDDRKV